jgi:hypothetical protein
MRKIFFSLILFNFFSTTTYCLAADIWVDVVNGDNSNDGLSAATALRTLQAAANQATPGTTVRIQPGVYRETIKASVSGTAQAPIIYQAEQGPVIIRGSELVTDWQPVTDTSIGFSENIDPKNLVFADLSSWGLTRAPRFVMQMDDNDNILNPFTLAREPDWQVQTEWKTHEFWWSADGGATLPECDPSSDKKPASCDQASRSFTQLMDQNDDTQPAGIEPGNLTTFSDLTGATLVAMDTLQGDYVYQRTIVAHDSNAGQITVDRDATRNSANNAEGLGWGTKYYVENHPALLDSPGEYWFDVTTGYLYLLPFDAQTPTLEIAKRDIGWDLTNLSYLTLDGLALELFNDKAILIQNDGQQSSYGHRLQNLRVHYASQGLFAEQVLTSNSSADNVIKDLVLENSEIGYIDNEGVYLGSRWDNDSNPDTLTHAPITNTLFKNNELHHLGFASPKEELAGLEFQFADNLRFEDNHVHHIAQHGLRFMKSVIQSDQGFGFAPSEIKTGDILLHNNLIEYTCQQVGECAAVTFFGVTPQQHVFRNVLVMGNTFRYNYGWSYAAEQRRRWVEGYFSFGLHLQNSSGIHAYRNLAYNNSWAGFFLSPAWRDGDVILYNNLFANAARGIDIWNPADLDTQNVVNTQILNNLIINNQSLGIGHVSPDANATNTYRLDNNLYYANGWNGGNKDGAMSVVRGDAYQRLSDIQANTTWETNGVSEVPNFFSYDYEALRQRENIGVLDVGLKTGSVAIEGGSATLPASLEALLAQFEIQDIQKQGAVWDIGPFEYSESEQPAQNPGLAMEMANFESQNTTAQFSGFVTTGLVGTSIGQRGNNLTFSQTAQVKIVAEINVASEDVGQSGEVMLVIAYTPPNSNALIYFMRQGTNWLVWDGQLTTLAATTLPGLPEQFELFDELPITITVYEGVFQNLPGHFTIYVGYSVDNKIVVFNGQNPIQFTIQ